MEKKRLNCNNFLFSKTWIQYVTSLSYFLFITKKQKQKTNAHGRSFFNFHHFLPKLNLWKYFTVFQYLNCFLFKLFVFLKIIMSLFVSHKEYMTSPKDMCFPMTFTVFVYFNYPPPPSNSKKSFQTGLRGLSSSGSFQGRFVKSI